MAGMDFLDALVRIVERNAARPGIVELFAILSAEATAPEHPSACHAKSLGGSSRRA